MHCGNGVPYNLSACLHYNSFDTYSNASSRSPYDSGYDHGCDDAKISDPNDIYINQPEKGTSFHTDEFM
jgi:hypothetical protein